MRNRHLLTTKEPIFTSLKVAIPVINDLFCNTILPYMQTRFLYTLLSLAALILTTTGCHNDRNILITGYGDLNFIIHADTTVKGIAGADNLSIPLPDIEKFEITASNSETGYSKTWKTLQEFEASHRKVPVGSYLFSASLGKMEEEGFDMLSFYGENSATVYDDMQTDVTLDCKVHNALVSASFSEAATKEFKNISLRMKSTKGIYIGFNPDEHRAAYIRPGTIQGEVTLTNQEGKTVTICPIEINNAQVSEHYCVRTDIAETSEGKALTFVYDEATLLKPATIPINDNLFNAVPPNIKTIGFSNNEPITILESERPQQTVRCEISVPNGLKSIRLTALSETLYKNELSHEIELVGNDLSILKKHGFVIEGNEENSTSAFIDFTEMIPELSAKSDEAATHYFIVQATDIYGMLANEPTLLAITTNPVKLQMDIPAPIDFDATTTDVKLSYNGTYLERFVKIQYQVNQDGTWLEATPTAIKQEGDSYTLTIPVPEGDNHIDLRAIYKNGRKTSNIVSQQRIIPEYTAYCGSENIWPSKADIFIWSEKNSKIIPYISVYVKEQDGEFHPAVVERVTDEGRITVSTLMPSTSYTIKIVAGIGSSTSKEQTFDITTEAALQLPNPSFEDNKTTIDISTINCGGKYSNLASWIPIYNTASIKVNEPKEWTSVNTKTCSSYSQPENTWFKVPTAEIVRKGYEGAFAVKLRNAAWDLHGVEPPRDARTDREYYSRNAPEFGYRSAGKLFLGSYIFFPDGREEYNIGYPFTSRPTAIQGMYSYIQDNQDLTENGLVIIQMLREEYGQEYVIGEGKGLLKPSTSFTRFVVPITYSIRNKNATKMKLLISSSCYASENQEEETKAIKTTNYLEKGISTGAELTVDDLILLYE